MQSARVSPASNLGVPQSSVLGLLLFRLYVDDLPELLDGETVNHFLHADDLKIYPQVEKNNIKEGIARLGKSGQLVAGWVEGSGLRFNAGKTKAIFSSPGWNVGDLRRQKPPGVEIQDGVFVPFSDTVLSLGVTLDSEVTWKPHINQVTTKVNEALYSFRLIMACPTETLRIRLVETSIQPHSDYCVLVYLDATDELRTRVQ